MFIGFIIQYLVIPVIIFLFHETDLFLVLYLSPRKLSIGKLDQHVEKGPQIIVTSLRDQYLNVIFEGNIGKDVSFQPFLTHFLVFVSIN